MPNQREAAAAGDTVVIAAGIYATKGSGHRTEPAYNPVNSGALHRPITFRAEGLVVLTLTESSGPVIGALSRNHIVWQGFTIREADAKSRADTGPVVIWDSIGIVIDGNTVIGDPKLLPPDNHPGIRIERSKQITIRNNVVSGFRCSPPPNGVNPANGAGIQLYTSDGIIIEHNEISESGSGIFLKGMYHDDPPFRPADSYTIRYNLVHNVGTGMAFHVLPVRADSPVLVYQNVIRNSNLAVRIWPFGSHEREPRHVKFVNNTLVDNPVALFIGAALVPDAGHIFQNNIVVGASTAVMQVAGEFRSAQLDSRRNVYHAFSKFAIVGESRNSIEPASINANPLFTDAKANNFRLQAASPARTAGLDVLDLDSDGGTTHAIPAGAYIKGTEVIGVDKTPAKRPF